MPWMSSLSSRRGTRRRVERVLRELHAGPAGWARRVRALLRPDRWRDAVLPLRPRRGLGRRDGADLVLHRRRAAAPCAGGLQALRGTPPRGTSPLGWRRCCGATWADHEPCLARAAAVDRFDVVTTVASSDARRDETHPLHRLVGELVKPLRPRYERLLRRTETAVTAHRFSAERYEATRRLGGRAVLLIDDTWTTGRQRPERRRSPEGGRRRARGGGGDRPLRQPRVGPQRRAAAPPAAAV